MGSCLAVRPEAYAAVRGFPRKNAAEDFYVLDKLAKVGTIARLAGTPLLLEGRLSDRVPFGTGKALSDLVSKKKALVRIPALPPRGVRAPRRVAARARRDRAPRAARMEAALDELPRGNPFFQTEALLGALEKMKAFAAMREAIAALGDGATMLRRVPHVVRRLPHAQAHPRAARRRPAVAAVAPGAGRGAVHGPLRVHARTRPSRCAGRSRPRSARWPRRPAGVGAS